MRVSQQFLRLLLPESTFVPYLDTYHNALLVTRELSRLFQRKVRLPTEAEYITMKVAHSHFTGFRDPGRATVYRSDEIGYAWLDGEVIGEFLLVPSACRGHNGSNFYLCDPGSGYSVIPVFG